MGDGSSGVVFIGLSLGCSIFQEGEMLVLVSLAGSITPPREKYTREGGMCLRAMWVERSLTSSADQSLEGVGVNRCLAKFINIR